MADRTGSSRPAIKAWITKKYKSVGSSFNNSLKKAVEAGVIAVHHQHKGSFKLVKKAPAKKKKAPAKKKKVVKKKKTTKNNAKTSRRGPLLRRASGRQ